MNTELVEAATRLISGLAPGGRPVAFRVSLADDEAKWFLQAVEESVISFSECGADCFRLQKWGATGPDHFETPSGKPRHLFSNPTASEAWLNREYVPHIAAYARALLELGYDPQQCSFSRYRKFSRDLIGKRQGQSYETDAEFYDTDGRVRLQIEAKASPVQTRRLASEIERAGFISELPMETVKEIEYVLDVAPRYLWVVGPESVDPARYVYEVAVTELNARFTPVESLPNATLPTTGRTTEVVAATTVDDFRCPSCGADESFIRGRPGPAAEIVLTCEKCHHQWSRQPAVSCPRCHTGAPYVNRVAGWQSDDPVEAAEDTMASYDDVYYDEYRCRRCNHDWRIEVARRAGRSGEPFARSDPDERPRRSI